MNKELPHPKSAPVQSPLQQSAKSLRIPSSSSENHPSYKRFLLPEFTPTSTSQKLPSAQSSPSLLNTKSSGRTSSSNDLVTSPYSSSNLHERKSSITIDTKRLVDQFYNHEANLSVSSAASPAISRQQSNSYQNVLNYASELVDSSMTPNAESDIIVGYDNYNFLQNTKLSDTNNAKVKDEIHLDLKQLQSKIFERVSTQINRTNESLNKDSSDFKEILDELNSIKLKFVEYIDLIQSHHHTFKEDYGAFKKELVQLYKSLEVIRTFEDSLSRSREKLTVNKKKLFDLRKKIEIGEDLKLKQLELTEVRKKWIIIGIMMMFIVYVFWKLL